jgi:hypothetical protein
MATEGRSYAITASGATLPSLVLDAAAQWRQVQWIQPLTAGTIKDVVTGQFFLGDRPFAILAWIVPSPLDRAARPGRASRPDGAALGAPARPGGQAELLLG